MSNSCLCKQPRDTFSLYLWGVGLQAWYVALIVVFNQFEYVLLLGSLVNVMAFVVPVCPPGVESPIARHLRVNGWQWSEELLMVVVRALAAEDVSDIRLCTLHSCIALESCFFMGYRSLSGLEVGDIGESPQWPAEVCTFIQRLASDSCPIHVRWHACYMSLVRPIAVQE